MPLTVYERVCQPALYTLQKAKKPPAGGIKITGHEPVIFVIFAGKIRKKSFDKAALMCYNIRSHIDFQRCLYD